MSEKFVPEHHALVAQVDEAKGRVYLNKGAKDRVKEGDIYLIFTMGGEVIDPITKKSLGIIEDVRFRGKVINVQPEFCTVEQDNFRPISPISRVISGLSEPNAAKIGDYARKISY